MDEPRKAPAKDILAHGLDPIDHLRRKANGIEVRNRELLKLLEDGDELREYPAKFVKVCQLLRDAGRTSKEEAFFFIASSILRIAESVERVDRNPRLQQLSAQMREIEQTEGLKDGEYWPLGEGPKAYEALRRQWDRVDDEDIAAEFRRHGEEGMAELYLNQREEFDRRFDTGRVLVHGPLPGDMEKKLRDGRKKRRRRE